MPIKYHCPNCGKRFVEWGAEKLGFKCPECEGVELARVGQQEEGTVSRRPSLKRIGQRMATRKVAKASKKAAPVKETEDVAEAAEAAEEEEAGVEEEEKGEAEEEDEKESADDGEGEEEEGELAFEEGEESSDEETLPEEGLPAQGNWDE